jgi:hypothetical protein
VLKHCYRGGDNFLLREFILKAEMLDDGVLGKIYSAKSNPQIDSGALAFFAASVFWRAAVHHWRYLRLAPISRIVLGPYQEQLRKFLLGEQRFPDSVGIWVWVSSYDQPSRAITTPHSMRYWDCHVHSFDIPGIRFMMIVGRALPDFVRLMCILNGRDQPILVSDAPDDILSTKLNELSRSTRLSDVLQKKGKWSWSL